MRNIVEKIKDFIYSICISFSDFSNDSANNGSISVVALLSFRSILLKIEVSISKAAATFRSGNSFSSRHFLKYSPKDFILS